MRSLTMLAAGAALMVAALGSSGCVLDWESRGTVTVRRERPAHATEPTVMRGPVWCPEPGAYETPPRVVAVRPCPPPVVAGRGHGRDIQVRNYRN